MFTGRLKTEIPQALVGCVACSFLGHNANQKTSHQNYASYFMGNCTSDSFVVFCISNM